MKQTHAVDHLLTYATDEYNDFPAGCLSTLILNLAQDIRLQNNSGKAILQRGKTQLCDGSNQEKRPNA